MSAPVALVLVSHSTDLARGVADLAAQMAPDVVIRTAAGGPDGGLGTSFDTVQAAIAAALDTTGVALPDGGGSRRAQGGVVVLADLGSSVLTVETVLELDESLAGSVVLARGPFVEGAVAAAVTAHGGATLDEVVASALDAAHSFAPAGTPGGTAAPGGAAGAAGEAGRPASDTVTGRVTVRNPLGLHARPAALVSRKVAELGAKVRVDGVDAASVLQLMALGAIEGRELAVEAEGPNAAEAVRAVVELIEGGFGET